LIKVHCGYIIPNLIGNPVRYLARWIPAFAGMMWIWEWWNDCLIVVIGLVKGKEKKWIDFLFVFLFFIHVLCILNLQ